MTTPTTPHKEAWLFHHAQPIPADMASLLSNAEHAGGITAPVWEGSAWALAEKIIKGLDSSRYFTYISAFRGATFAATLLPGATKAQMLEVAQTVAIATINTAGEEGALLLDPDNITLLTLLKVGSMAMAEANISDQPPPAMTKAVEAAFAALQAAPKA